MSEPINRRDFIKLSIATVAALAGCRIIPAIEAATTLPETDPVNAVIDRVMAHRRRFALNTVPSALSQENLIRASNLNWESSERNQIIIEASEAEKPLALACYSIVKLLVGENSPRFFSKIIFKRGVMCANYDPDTKEMVFYSEKYDLNAFNFFVGSFLHEIGHAISYGTGKKSPDKNVYPLNKLISVLDGIWQVLGQADQVENIFLSNPDATNVPFIHKNFGQGVAAIFKKEKNVNFVGQTDSTGAAFLRQVIDRIADSRGEDESTIKFSRRFCYEIGQACLADIFSGKLALSGKLYSEWYLPPIEGSFEEFWADMFKLALIKPEMLQDNPEALTGVVQVLSAIKGKPIDLLVLKTQIEQIVSELKFSVDTADQLASVNTFLPIKNQGVLEEEFEMLARRGMVPDRFKNELSPEAVAVLSEYSRCLCRVYVAYNEVEVALLPDDISFSPKLDFWDTDENARACNPKMNWNFILNPKSVLDNLEVLKHYIKILSDFSESEDFRQYFNHPILIENWPVRKKLIFEDNKSIIKYV